MGGTPSVAKKDDNIMPCGRTKRNRSRDLKDFVDLVPTPLMESLNPEKKNMIENLDRVFELSEDPSLGAEKNENYGIIPLNVLHNVMLFQRLPDLLSISLTCSLFYNAHNSTYFWKSYYHHYFDSFNLPKEESPQDLNWKKQFFKRYFQYSDLYYRRKYKVVHAFEHSPNGDTDTVPKDLKIEPSSRMKIVLVGATGSGKSSYSDNLLGRDFKNVTESTIGARFLSLSLEYKTRREPGIAVSQIDVWDTAGQIRYRSLTPMYYRGSNAVMVFFAVNDMDGYDEAKRWVKEIKRNCREEIHITLVGTKADLCEERVVTFEKHVGPYLSNLEKIFYVETSSKENINNFKALGLTVDYGFENVKLEKQNEYLEENDHQFIFAEENLVSK